ncbi:MAG: response regulator transcription factor [Chlorobi bacterium]|nr:response regulator transcription factor [Chlorobiota bacterium]
MINIYLIDDHPALLTGIKTSIEGRANDIAIKGYSTKGNEALKEIAELFIDIVVLDLKIPEMNGIEICSVLKREHADLKVIAYTGELDPNILFNVWLKGADAILLKGNRIDELIEVIRMLYSNNGRRKIGKGVPFFFDQEIKTINRSPGISPTEMEVLKLLAEGYIRKEVAEKLYRSINTIDFHCRNILRKFNSKSMREVIKTAKKNGVIY